MIAETLEKLKKIDYGKYIIKSQQQIDEIKYIIDSEQDINNGFMINFNTDFTKFMKVEWIH